MLSLPSALRRSTTRGRPPPPGSGCRPHDTPTLSTYAARQRPPFARRRPSEHTRPRPLSWTGRAWPPPPMPAAATAMRRRSWGGLARVWRGAPEPPRARRPGKERKIWGRREYNGGGGAWRRRRRWEFLGRGLSWGPAGSRDMMFLMIEQKRDNVE